MKLDQPARPLRTALLAVVTISCLCLNQIGHAALPKPHQTAHDTSQFVRLMWQARQALSIGDRQKALVYLKLAVGMEPDNAIARAELGIAALESGDFYTAEDQLRIARRQGVGEEVTLVPLFEAMLTLGESQTFLDLYEDPGDQRTPLAAMILRARAAALQTLGKSAEASNAVTRSLAIKRDVSSLITAGRIALMQGNVSSANSFTDEGLRLSPTDVDVNVLKIQVALQSSKPTQAVALANQFVTKSPRSLALRLARINAELTVGETERAKPDVALILSQARDLPIAVYDRAIILARENNIPAAWDVAHGLPWTFMVSQPEIANNLADMAIGAGFPDTGLKILNEAVSRNPGLLDLRLKLAALRLRQKSAQYALNLLAPVEDSKDPRVSILFAEAYLQSGHADRASDYIKRAIALGGGEELMVLGAEEALKGVRAHLQRDPNNVRVHRLYASLLLRSGDLANARTQYEELVRAKSPDALSLNNLAWLVQKDEPGRALNLARRAVNLEPNSPSYQDTLGWIELNQSHAKDALGPLKRAHELRPDDPQISYHLARALDADGARGPAKALLQSAIAHGGFPEIDQAKTMLAAWH